MKVKYEIIDNFLDIPTFTELQNFIIFTPAIPWQYNQRIEGLDVDGTQKIGADGKFDMSNIKSQNWRLSYLVHPIFTDYHIQSEHFPIVVPILNQLNVKALIRVKINLYPYQETLSEHG